MIEPNDVEKRLLEAFPDANIQIEDLTGTKDHYQARVVSAVFEGKSPVQQHQLVYKALVEEMKGPIHALALNTYTPEGWAKKEKSS